jgi:hypothetical protein
LTRARRSTCSRLLGSDCSRAEVSAADDGTPEIRSTFGHISGEPQRGADSPAQRNALGSRRRFGRIPERARFVRAIGRIESRPFRADAHRGIVDPWALPWPIEFLPLRGRQPSVLRISGDTFSVDSRRSSVLPAPAIPHIGTRLSLQDRGKMTRIAEAERRETEGARLRRSSPLTKRGLRRVFAGADLRRQA